MAEADAGRSTNRTWWAALALLFVLAAGLRLYLPGPVTQTVDEVVWLKRSDAFRTAFAEGRMEDATAARPDQVATMPGVTTMWAGAIGRSVAQGMAKVGVIDDIDQPSVLEPNVLRAGRAIVGLTCAAAIAMIAAMGARVLGRRAALAAGVLLACEPFLVGHGTVLHTDALVSLTSAAGVLTLLAARSDGRWRLPMVGLAGFWGALALLTKTNAFVTLGAAVGVTVVMATVSEWRAGRLADGGARRGWLVATVKAGVVGGATVAVISVAAWPALWAAPRAQWRLLRLSTTQLDQASVTFLSGKAGSKPGWTFYPVNIGVRFSPWLLVLAVAGLVVLLVPAARRRAGVAGWIVPVLVVPPAVYLVVITGFSDKVYDRYTLPIAPYLALTAGVAIAAVAAEALRLWRPDPRTGVRAERGAALLVTVALAAVTLGWSPYAISYVSPLVGTRADEEILLGWGEGTEVLGQEIARREAGRCDEVVVMAPQAFHIALPCGRLIGIDLDVGRADYVVSYINRWQRNADVLQIQAAADQGDLVATVEIQGITYGRLYAIRDGGGSDDGSGG